MSEPIWCNVKCKVPRSWFVLDPPWFVHDMGGALLNGSGPDIDEETEEFAIWGVDGEGNYGLSDSWLEPVLDWMREQRIPFVAIADAKYEWLGEYVFNDGFTERQVEYGGENVVLPDSTFMAWKDLPDDELAAKVRNHFSVGEPGLSNVSIAHLPTECPPRPEEPAMTTIQFGEDDDGVPISWPARWVICHDCRGDGTRVLHGMAFTSDDIEEAGGMDFLDDMRSGMYDTVCRDCNGEGKVLEVDTDRLDKHEIARLHMLQREKWESEAADRSEAIAFGYDR